MSPTVLGKRCMIAPISENDSTNRSATVLHHAPPSTVRRHAQRCREGEWTVRRVTHRIRTDEGQRMGRMEEKPQKLWQVEKTEHERRERNWRLRRKGAAGEERGGLESLPVPPVSWDYLHLQSTVAQQKEREHRITHTSQPSPSPLPNGL